MKSGWRLSECHGRSIPIWQVDLKKVKSGETHPNKLKRSTDDPETHNNCKPIFKGIAKVNYKAAEASDLGSLEI